MPNSPVDRTFNLIVTPTLIWHDANNIGATIAYSQGASTPQMPPVVNPGNGKIDLRTLPANANYTDRVLINISLDQSQLKDINGNPLPGGGRWAYDNEGTAPSLGGCFFCAVYQLGGPVNTTPIQVPNMNAGRTDSTPGSTVFIYYNPDMTRRNQPITLQFCLGLVLPNYSNYYITIDPQVIGKGGGTSPMDDVEDEDEDEDEDEG
jgi:hypothetical protein